MIQSEGYNVVRGYNLGTFYFRKYSPLNMAKFVFHSLLSPEFRPKGFQLKS